MDGSKWSTLCNFEQVDVHAAGDACFCGTSPSVSLTYSLTTPPPQPPPPPLLSPNAHKERTHRVSSTAPTKGVFSGSRLISATAAGSGL